MASVPGGPTFVGERLRRATTALFAVWIGIAAIIYFTYSARHSRLARGEVVVTEEPE